MNLMQALALIGLRLIGFFGLVVHGPSVGFYAPSLLDALMTNGATADVSIRDISFGALHISLALLSSFALIVLARPLSRLMTPKAVTANFNANLDADLIARLSISIIGLALIAYGLPRLLARWAEIVFALLQTDPSAGVSLSMGVHIWPNAVLYFFSVAVGTGFLLAAFRIGPFLRPLRRAGTGARLDDDAAVSSQSDK